MPESIFFTLSPLSFSKKDCFKWQSKDSSFKAVLWVNVDSVRICKASQPFLWASCVAGTCAFRRSQKAMHHSVQPDCCCLPAASKRALVSVSCHRDGGWLDRRGRNRVEIGTRTGVGWGWERAGTGVSRAADILSPLLAFFLSPLRLPPSCRPIRAVEAYPNPYSQETSGATPAQRMQHILQWHGCFSGEGVLDRIGLFLWF